MHDCIRTLEKQTRHREATRFQQTRQPWQRGPQRVVDTVADRSAYRAYAARRVLVIEDNRDGRETLCTLLELVGFKVEVAADGAQGLNKALSHPPDAAIIDIGLPALDGYQVAQKLRSVFGRNILLIAHTGYGQPEDRRRALEAGFDVHLTKPVDFRELAFLIGGGVDTTHSF
jgi:CheY-like chemotaxis protein